MAHEHRAQPKHAPELPLRRRHIADAPEGVQLQRRRLALRAQARQAMLQHIVHDWLHARPLVVVILRNLVLHCPPLCLLIRLRIVCGHCAAATTTLLLRSGIGVSITLLMLLRLCIAFAAAAGVQALRLLREQACLLQYVAVAACIAVLAQLLRFRANVL